jgi:Tfp pilus assembly protein PilX
MALSSKQRRMARYAEARLQMALERREAKVRAAEDELRALGIKPKPRKHLSISEPPTPKKRKELDALVAAVGVRAALLENAEGMARAGADPLTVNACRDLAMMIPPDFGKKP